MIIHREVWKDYYVASKDYRIASKVHAKRLQILVVSMKIRLSGKSPAGVVEEGWAGIEGAGGPAQGWASAASPGASSPDTPPGSRDLCAPSMRCLKDSSRPGRTKPSSLIPALMMKPIRLWECLWGLCREEASDPQNAWLRSFTSTRGCCIVFDSLSITDCG